MTGSVEHFSHEVWFFYESVLGLLKINLLGQKYTTVNILVAIHKPLVESLTSPLDRFGAVQLNLTRTGSRGVSVRILGRPF